MSEKFKVYVRVKIAPYADLNSTIVQIGNITDVTTVERVTGDFPIFVTIEVHQHRCAGTVVAINDIKLIYGVTEVDVMSVIPR